MTLAGPSNTGYANAPGYPGSLADGSGLTITSNQTYSFYDFPGGVSVGTDDASVENVTFTGCRFRGLGGDQSLASFVPSGAGNFTFSYCSFVPAVSAPPVTYAEGYQFGIYYPGGPLQLTASNCDIWGWGNAASIAGGVSQSEPMVFQTCWIHNARADGGVDHTDGIGSESAGDGSDVAWITIDSCTIESAGNTNGLAFQRVANFSDLTITGNLFGGFGYTVNIDPTDGGSASGIVFTGNTFSTLLEPGYGPLYGADFVLTAGSVWRNNRWLVPEGAAWGNPAHSGWYWIPFAAPISGGDDTPFVSQEQPMAIAEDASTPAVATATGDTTGVITTASFTPPANSLLVVIVNVGFKATNGSTLTISDSVSGSYTAGPFVHNSNDENSGIWYRYLSSAPGAMTVTATDTNTGQAGRQLAVRVLTGGASSQSGAASQHATGNATSYESSITTTAAGSWVYVAGAMDNDNLSLAADANTTSIGVLNDGIDFETCAAGRQAAATGVPGATTLGWTSSSSTSFTWAALEILPAAAPPPGGTTYLTGSAVPALVSSAM